MAEKEYVKCQHCGTLHDKVEGMDDLTPYYYRIVGNVHVNERGGIVGNSDWIENGVPSSYFCTTCVDKVFKYKRFMSPDEKNALITQEVSDKPVLTVEDYCKWYDVYIIQPNGQVIPTSELDTDDVYDSEGRSWYDHCPTPAYFHKLAKHLGATYDSETFGAVCTRFVEDILNNDWTKLHVYLPK